METKLTRCKFSINGIVLAAYIPFTTANVKRLYIYFINNI